MASKDTKQHRIKVIPKRPEAKQRKEVQCHRLEEEIEKFVRQSPGQKATIREICKQTHIAADILIYHVRIRKEKGLVHFENSESDIGLDTVICIDA